MSVKNYRNINFRIVFSVFVDADRVLFYGITEIGRNILYDIEKIFGEYSNAEIYRIYDLNNDKLIYTNNKEHKIPYIFRAHNTLGV